MDWKLINFMGNTESDGSLVYIETIREIPFEIKRIFYIFNTPEGVTRANHACKDTEFMLICISGSVRIELKNEYSKSNFLLSSSNMGLYVPKLTWIRTFDFSRDSVLLAFASSSYDKNQYIEDYEEYLKFRIKKENNLL
ncbi:FdtA/QdtA family cupin domain-containing protein [Clostridium sp. YIM B02506]|uniref:sugar 3,4-ketoisomerase n=1 Tax=Clostridium sp. YIM B02506 TaxID=2910680 RepID=UPI001EEF1F9F|nr:FdtA/QdtA family cupin domain-containing protein [Clostridium sp. YIM B02506]